jgi:hypothetical protein
MLALGKSWGFPSKETPTTEIMNWGSISDKSQCFN